MGKRASIRSRSRSDSRSEPPPPPPELTTSEAGAVATGHTLPAEPLEEPRDSLIAAPVATSNEIPAVAVTQPGIPAIPGPLVGLAVVARFCVDTHGRVEPGSVKITHSFGDIAVDRIARTAVIGWRFSPLKLAGVPRRACGQTHFNIRFN